MYVVFRSEYSMLHACYSSQWASDFNANGFLFVTNSPKPIPLQLYTGEVCV